MRVPRNTHLSVVRSMRASFPRYVPVSSVENEEVPSLPVPVPVPVAEEPPLSPPEVPEAPTVSDSAPEPLPEAAGPEEPPTDKKTRKRK